MMSTVFNHQALCIESGFSYTCGTITFLFDS